MPHEPMKLASVAAAAALALVTSFAPPARSQDSAPSSHFVFDDDFAGDILINEVRVPADGEAKYTYYEALGWRGKAGGYAGIQAHPKAHLFLFSIWDHKEHTAPIEAVYRGPGTETVKFGGEGTGLKSWNFTLGWSTGVWYTLVARCWPVGSHTHFGFWSRAGDTGKWTHLVTMDVAARATFESRTDAFIEDWLDTGDEPRTTHLRGGWKRKPDGAWFPFGAGRYSVNTWDLDRGKRSYNFRTSWNGGLGRDESGEYYFMTSGGKATTPATTNPAGFAIERSRTEPDYAKMKVLSASTARTDATTLSVSWEMDERGAPPFACDIKIYDNRAGSGRPLVAAASQAPHARSQAVDVSSLKPAEGPYFMHVKWEDIFGRSSETTVLAVDP